MKHAYLIMAHTRPDLLERLVRTLDYMDNDIYIHLDSKMGMVDLSRFFNAANLSRLIIVDRMDVVWGDKSQIDCELQLIESALENNKYSYLHLLSGYDLPIKSQEYIHQFFKINNGKEFVHFETKDLTGANYQKVALYHPLQKYIGGKRGFLYYIQRILIRAQSMLHVNRIRKDKYIYGKGANWFSITGDFAAYLVSKRKWIDERFKSTLCCDEIFMQTILLNSPYVKSLYNMTFDDNYNGNMRYIEWVQGTSNPKNLKAEDYEKLKASNKLFARKFADEFTEEMLSRLLKEEPKIHEFI